MDVLGIISPCPWALISVLLIFFNSHFLFMYEHFLFIPVNAKPFPEVYAAVLWFAAGFPVCVTAPHMRPCVFVPEMMLSPVLTCALSISVSAPGGSC